ncbi:MAG: hypothetical protein R2911_28065 [Caldilineaceae bacterium]
MMLGAYAVQIHSGWQLPDWIGHEAGILLRKFATAEQDVPSRELEFHLDAIGLQRRIASHGEWTSPEWQEYQGVCHD